MVSNGEKQKQTEEEEEEVPSWWTLNKPLRFIHCAEVETEDCSPHQENGEWNGNN